MTYVDGFVLVIPKKNLAAYKKMAAKGGEIWMKHGALQYIEAVGDDLKPNGIVRTFPKLTKIKPTETVVFSFITFKNRKHRDTVNAKVMKDPAMDPDEFKDQPMPMDMKKMSYGGFEAIVDR